MIILKQTYFNTTTMATTTNGTATVAYLFDRNRGTQWSSENAGSDATAATMRIVFAATTSISNIILANHNLKSFSIHPGTTTSNFSPAVSSTTNSATSLYFSFATSTVTEIVATMNTTITAGQEKSIGELIISELLYDFATDRLPTAGDYDAKIDRKQIIHTMSDGGIALYNIASRFSAEIKLDFVPTVTAEALRTVFNLATPFIFVPFETSTSWNGIFPECVWPGAFEFEEFTDNSKTNGFIGKVRMRQTPGGTYP